MATPLAMIPAARTPLARRAAAAFGLGGAAGTAGTAAPPAAAAVPAAGEVVLFGGPSGGGKSTALRATAAAAARAGWDAFDVDRRRLRAVPSVDQFGHSGDPAADLDFAASLLSRVGLGEAAAMLRLPGELSDGQRWRLRLAVTVARVMRGRGRRPALLVADEFCAVLDRTTAAVVARGLRRTIDRLSRVGLPVAAAVATSHDDLRPALLPDRVEWREQ